jgi:hypothetical protein
MSSVTNYRQNILQQQISRERDKVQPLRNFWQRGDAQYGSSNSDKLMYKLTIFPAKQNPTCYTEVSVKPCMPQPRSISLHLNVQKASLWWMRDRLQLGTGTVCMSSHHMESIARLISTFNSQKNKHQLRDKAIFPIQKCYICNTSQPHWNVTVKEIWQAKRVISHVNKKADFAQKR